MVPPMGDRFAHFTVGSLAPSELDRPTKPLLFPKSFAAGASTTTWRKSRSFLTTCYPRRTGWTLRLLNLSTTTRIPLEAELASTPSTPKYTHVL
jgi:hypothetical protein